MKEREFCVVSKPQNLLSQLRREICSARQTHQRFSLNGEVGESGERDYLSASSLVRLKTTAPDPEEEREIEQAKTDRQRQDVNRDHHEALRFLTPA